MWMLSFKGFPECYKVHFILREEEAVEHWLPTLFLEIYLHAGFISNHKLNWQDGKRKGLGCPVPWHK